MMLRRRKFTLFIATFLLALPLGAQRTPADGTVAVVASSDIDNLSEQQIRLLFSLKKRLINGNQSARILVLPTSSDVAKSFAKGVFDIYPYQLQRLWDRQVYSGRAKAPQVVESETRLLEIMSSSPATVGFIRWDPETLNRYKGKVNVLAVY